jgi:hypothetical protein
MSRFTKFLNISSCKLLAALILFSGLGLSSCHNLTCPECNRDYRDKPISNYPYYHFELEKKTSVVRNDREVFYSSFDAFNPELHIDKGDTILTCIIIENSEDKEVYREILWAKRKAEQTTSEEKQEELYELYENLLRTELPKLKAEVMLTPSYNEVIKRITIYSDPDVPPRDTILTCSDCITCWRDRNCIKEKTGFIDKIELRAMVGYRYNEGAYYKYPIPYSTPFEKEVFSFDEEGTYITVGLEASALFKIDKLSNKRNNFHLGVMAGIWPVDGSIFIPVGLHTRYTFDDEADNKNCDCNAWYLFGDIGLALDAAGNAPVVCLEDCENSVISGYWDIGIGYDLWVSRCMDISIDAGYRLTNLPFESKFECSECDNKYPVRTANQIFLRLGVTF